MKYIKRFENLDFSQATWATTADFLNMYYCCDNCDSSFKTLNKELEKCPSCGCPKPDPLTEEEYYTKIKSKANEAEIEEIEKERGEDSRTIIDMMALSDREKNKRFYN